MELMSVHAHVTTATQIVRKILWLNHPQHTYNIVIGYQGHLEDIALLCLNEEEEHRLETQKTVGKWTAFEHHN